MKTIAKKLSFLREEKSYTLADVFRYCRTDDTGLKLYKDILREKKKIELNYKLMQLYSPSISVQNSRHIKETIESFAPALNRTEILKMMSTDGIHDYNWNSLFQKFRSFIAAHRDYLHHGL